MAQTLVLNCRTTVHLQIYRGDSGAFLVNFIDDTGLPIDVSTATFLCQVRDRIDGTVFATLDVEPVPGVPDQAQVIVSESASAAIEKTAVWDLQVRIGVTTATPLGGQVIVAKDVSHA